jgi:hypothetical protein
MSSVPVLAAHWSVRGYNLTAKRSTRLGKASRFRKIEVDKAMPESMQFHSHRAEYSEHEAAIKLGLTIDQLRGLVTRHLMREGDCPATVFQATDLVLLRVLSSMSASAG